MTSIIVPANSIDGPDNFKSDVTIGCASNCVITKPSDVCGDKTTLSIIDSNANSEPTRLKWFSDVTSLNVELLVRKRNAVCDAFRRRKDAALVTDSRLGARFD